MTLLGAVAANAQATLDGGPENWRVVGAGGEPAFQNSWSNSGGAFTTARFYKDSLGRVHLTGMVTRASYLQSTIFTLPVGYRPPIELEFATGNTIGYINRIRILTTGEVRFEHQENSAVSLAGISFDTDTAGMNLGALAANNHIEKALAVLADSTPTYLNGMSGNLRARYIGGGLAHVYGKVDWGVTPFSLDLATVPRATKSGGFVMVQGMIVRTSDGSVFTSRIDLLGSTLRSESPWNASGGLGGPWAQWLSMIYPVAPISAVLLGGQAANARPSQGLAAAASPQTPTLINSWVNYNGGSEGSGQWDQARYYKVGGRVYLSGLIKSGSLGSDSFVLPAGYRPGGTEAFTTVCSYAAAPNTINCDVNVEADGSFTTSFLAGGNGYLNLNGISFRAEN